MISKGQGTKKDLSQGENREKKIIRFSLSEEEYGVPIEFIKEILYAKKVHPLPGARAGVEGMIDLRGTVIPVIDLRNQLKRGAPRKVPPKHLLILAVNGREMGWPVDRVNEVLTVRLEQLQTVDGCVDTKGFAVESVCRIGGRLVMMLDPERLLRVIGGSPDENKNEIDLAAVKLFPETNDSDFFNGGEK